jgi:hypothetical protein
MSGYAVSGAGDVNGDGYDDVVIGAYGANPHGTQSGESYVVYGGSSLGSVVELSGLDGTDGFTVRGVDQGDFSGKSLAAAGDVDDDGWDDLIIGAPRADPHGSNCGETNVVYGASDLGSVIELSGLDGTDGFLLRGVDPWDYAGTWVKGAGDVDGDGYDDVVIGAPGADPQGKGNAGESYVVYGGTGIGSVIELSSLDGAGGFLFRGLASDDSSGRSVSGADDVDSDGYDDVIIGAPGADPHGSGSGESYILYGAVPPTPSATSTATPTNTQTATATSTATPTPTSTETPTTTPTLTPIPTSTPTATATLTPTPTDTLTPMPTHTPTPTDTLVPTETPMPTVTDTPTATDTVTPTASHTPTATDTPTPTDTATPTATSTPTPAAGDANADGKVDAGDISALILEIFDGDGNLAGDTPGGTFPGNPTGCDANADGYVDAGDISCTILIIFNGPGSCG